MVFVSSFKDTTKPDARYVDQVGVFFWNQLDRFSHKVLFVDYASGRQLTGSQIKHKASQVASYLRQVVRLPPESHCVMFCKNNDTTHLIALGLLFAGASVCVWHVADLQCEKQHIVDCLEPRIVFCEAAILDQCLEIRGQASSKFTICVIDDDKLDLSRQVDSSVVGYQRDIVSHEASNLKELPVQVSPDHAAYVLMTSGSTGLPKPVARSHRNSIYVCHSLQGEVGRMLWSMDENSILAGFQELDHGTGTFALKMCLAKGLRLIIIDGYRQEWLLDAISRYKITDSMLGSAYLHNLMAACVDPSSDLLKRYDLTSLRNMITIGGRLTSPELRDQFEQRLGGQLSVRSAYGLTECGFVALEPRARENRAPGTVGRLLPFAEIKILELDSGREIADFGRQGELLLRGPQVSPGYLGRGLAEQQRAAFLADGFYKTNDIVKLNANGHLAICGRIKEVLCLSDGWKVLPSQLESLIMEMAAVHEAVVIGIPDEQLPGNQKPRAYVVLKPESRGRVTESDVAEFVAGRTCEPKQLRGGVRLLTELPRVTLGKVDRQALRQMDGY